MSDQPIVGVVGPCKSGKSTLIKGLQQNGYAAKQIAQEHSFVPRMWRQIGKPDVLIYLHCEYESTLARGMNWTQAEYAEQQPRLVHARQHADLELTTDIDSPTEILARVLSLLENFEA